MMVLTPRYVVCANAGDSRAVLARQGDEIALVSLPLSLDHKPDNISEQTRIENAGGFVSDGRVNGDLAVSRSLGDYRFKHMPTVLGNTTAVHPEHAQQHHGLLSRFRHRNHNNHENDTPTITPEQQQVSPMPDILVQERNSDRDLFVVCACDGIWDVQTNEECCQTISNIFSEGETNMGLVCEELLDYCLEIGSKDNMTALIVKFPAQEIGEGGGVMARRELRKQEQLNKNENDETESAQEE